MGSSQTTPATGAPVGVPLALCAVVVAMVSVQGGAAMGKQLFPAIGPEGATALRLLFASIILWMVWRPWRHWPTRAAWPSLLVYGVALGGMNLTFYMSLSRIPLGVAVALEFTGPLLLAVATSRRPRDFLYAGMAIAGVILLLPIHAMAAHLDLLGVAYALIAGVFWAVYILFGKRSSSAAPGGSVAAIGMLVAMLVAFPAGVAQAGTALLSPALLPVAIGVAILSSAIPYSLEMIALKRLPAQTFSILMSGEPAMGAIFGLLVLQEHLSANQWVAIALIVTASVGTSLSAAREHAAPGS
ncbi:EamA family transporter [Aquabacter cavernae]|uniref:EamA family transporter n=1 Tax=Aquabacter cavernae TaxID=2496029 RepID=UPI00196B0F24|nr:DMT family transporter [Aquabacter cavernae]